MLFDVVEFHLIMSTHLTSFIVFIFTAQGEKRETLQNGRTLFQMAGH